jgi:predicted transcriptional regulator
VKAGRAYLYRPRLTAEDARAQALGQVLDSFFGGSKEALLAQLGNGAAVRRAAAGASPASGGEGERRLETVPQPATGSD